MKRKQRPLAYKIRSIWKGNYLSFCFNNKIMRRNETINFKDVGKNVYILNGKIKFYFDIEKKYIGYKFGQLFFTKKMGYNIHNDKKKKKK